MPEIKHNFTGGKMNKDVDQRLVPKGEYRDAMNIQVSTSEGSDVGTVQNILGNKLVDGLSFLNPNSTCVGAIADEKNDAFYWFIAGNEGYALADFTSGSPQPFVKKDSIVQYKNGQVTPVFTDVAVLAYTIYQAGGNITWDSTAGTITFPNGALYQNINIGMDIMVDSLTLQGIINTGIITVTGVNGAVITVNGDLSWLDNNVTSQQAYHQTRLVFSSNGVGTDHVGILGFTPNNMITGINIIDDMLFWTDGETEPKKINIPRSKEGTDDNGQSHTRLLVEGIDKGLVREEHVTVIRKAPKTPLNININTGRDDDKNYSGIVKIDDGVVPNTSSYVSTSLANGLYDFSALNIGDEIRMEVLSDVLYNNIFSLEWQEGTKVVLTEDLQTGELQLPVSAYSIKGVITTWSGNNFNSNSGAVKVAIKVLSISGTPPVANPDTGYQDYVIDRFDESEKLFEFKFPRFSYRYKYIDNEYSPYAPFTQPAFIPGSFDYHPKKGYNLGMTNKAVSIDISDYITPDLPKDVVQIDILYKDDSSPNVYIVDELTPNDHVNQGSSANFWYNNLYTLTDETISSTVASNQLLRPWDNVPRKAKAQEVSGNRLIYANYLQNYSLNVDGTTFYPEFNTSVVNVATTSDSIKSIKALREYQIGVVFGDEYGRETPVISNPTGSFKLEKEAAGEVNKLKVSIKDQLKPSNLEYYKFFIKETSSEYYNMAMDRFYDAEDGNFWIAFPSSDRNKIDIDTFLILKKAASSTTLVAAEARYKVIAIENEAPVFIKTSRLNIGTLVHDMSTAKPQNDLFSTTFVGAPGSGSSTFTINATPFQGSSLKDITNIKEPLYVEFGNLSTNSKSDRYRISAVSTQDPYNATTSTYEFTLEKELRTDVNFISNDPGGNMPTEINDQTTVTFYKYVIENKAKFDGRFFVKIFADNTFEESMSVSTISTGYRVLDEKKIYLLSNNIKSVHNQPNSKVFGGTSPWPGLDCNCDDYAVYAAGCKLWQYHQAFFTGDQESDYTTQTNCGFVPNKIKERGTDFDDVWFIDEGWSTATNGADNLWDNGISSGSYPNNNNDNANGVGINDYSKSSQIALSFGPIVPPGVSSNGVFGTGYNNLGQAEAISGSYKSGFMGGNQFWDLTASWNTSYNHMTPWISKLVSGARFRWKEDPTETVYTMSGSVNYYNRINYEANTQGNVHAHDMPENARKEYKFSCVPSHSSWNPTVGNADGIINGSVVVDSYITNPGYSPITFAPITASAASTGFTIKVPSTQYWTSYSPTVHVKRWPITRGMALTKYGTTGSYTTLSPPILVEDITDDGNDVAITFVGYSNTTVNLNISANDELVFKQPVMNGLSENSAKNINDYNPISLNDNRNGIAAVGYTMQFIEDIIEEDLLPDNPAIWETEPKDNTDLDIYYEISGAIPLELNKHTVKQVIPTLSKASLINGGASVGLHVIDNSLGNTIKLSQNLCISAGGCAGVSEVEVGDRLTITKPNGSYFGLEIITINAANTFTVEPDLSTANYYLNWHNCYSFGNGVESNRVRDNFNLPYVSNGVKVSSKIDSKHGEERREYGLIYSGLYNSTSGVNNLNQFIAAEKITKDINPIYGSIQKLHSGWGQGGDLIALCEDRILKILANKDALYNADGNTNVTSTNNVLGQAIPYSGEYGISENPESFASEAYRVYFTDKVRGTVMRLSMDGLTPISNHGMKDWFRDNLKLSNKLVGSYDDKKDEYNITIKGDTIAKTVTFKEDVKGWVSFKSFTPENAISCANEYYTFLDGRAWKHHDETQPRNTFYDHALAPSTLEVVFNEVPGSVKSFKTINYEGSQAKVTSKDENGVTFMDGEYFNLSDVDGWYVENIVTNLEQGGITEFVNKEGKWFGYVTGNDVTHTLNGDVSGNYYTEDFSIQGVGRTISAVNSTVFGCTNPNTYNYNPAANQDDGSCVAVVSGCLDPNAFNYYPGANVDDGSCVYLGCTTGPLAVWSNQSAGGSINYDPNATQDDGSCITAVFGCTDNTMFNHNGLANVGTAILSDGTNCGYENCACIPVIYGCTDPNADNYITPVDAMQDVNTDNGSCIYNGCTDPYADNYDFADPTTAPPGWDGIVGVNIGGSISYAWLNGTAVDDGSCTYPGGCTDSTACNYDSTPGMVDNGSCQYCGDDDAVNYDGAQDTSCTTNCTYCEQPVPLTISAQATSDPNMNNGSVTLEWAQSTSATIQYYQITINNGSPINVNPSGNATETHTINNLAPGTYDFQVIARCTQTSVLGTVSATPIFIQTHITVTPILGCTDYGQTYYGGVTNPAGGTWGACNFNPAATQDDGSCEYTTCTGCNDPLYVEYCGDCWDTTNQVVVASGGSNWVADTIPPSCSTLIVYGCTDPTAFNYNSLATVDDGSCVPVVLGCIDSTLNNNGTYAASNYDVTANTDDGSCLPYNCPIVAVASASGGIQINYALAATAYSPNIAAGGYPNDFTLGLTVTSSTGTSIFSEANYGGMSAGSNYVHYDNISPTTLNTWALGQTAITVLFTVDSNDGLCSVSNTVTYTVGCTDPLANNHDPNFDITDNSQCVYSGCTDNTPAVMNSNADAATNYDPNATVSCGTNNDNECCTYHGDQDLSKWAGGVPGYWMASIVYEPESTGYTEAVMSTFTIGEAPGAVATANNLYPMSGMTTSFNDRAIGPINFWEWQPYVYNDQLKITVDANFDGACDNDFLSDQLPTGSVSKTFTWSVGCKDDNTAVNYDPNVDLGMASTCIVANPGCMDPTATNHGAAFNQDCTELGSANPNDCCCYTCSTPHWETPAVTSITLHSSGLYATQVVFNFSVVSNASAYTLTQKNSTSGAIMSNISFTSSSSGYSVSNGVVSYVFNNNNSAHLMTVDNTYDFEITALCQNGDGQPCDESGISSVLGVQIQ